MKAITILQPWASLIACGAKKIETRSWPTKYRGPIAIHAGLKVNGRSAEERSIAETLHKAGIAMTRDLPVGSVIAIANLVDCIQINESHVYYLKLHQEQGVSNEYAFGDFTLGRYAWKLENVCRIEPVPTKGRQRLWEWEGP